MTINDKELTTRRIAARAAALSAISEELVAWYDDQIANLPSPIEWQQMLGDSYTSTRGAIELLKDRMLTPQELRGIRLLVRDLGSYVPRLYAEDKRVINEIRCSLVDCLQHVEDGCLSAAYTSIEQGQKRFDWMLHGRKRDGYEIKRQIPADVRPKIVDAFRRVSAAVLCVGRAAAVVA